VTATGVSGTGDGVTGYTQYVLTFTGAGTNAIDNGVSPNLGNSFTTLKSGLFQLNMTGSKVHAGPIANMTNTAADQSQKFWVLYGAVNASDIKINGALADGVTDTLLVSAASLNDAYATFGSDAPLPDPPIYKSAFDWNVDGKVDPFDLNLLYANFGIQWKF